MNEIDEVVGEFLVESYENLDLLDRDLLLLEGDPRSATTLASVFRTIHTIKGTCGFLGFAKLESVTHVGENLLSKLRDGVFVLDATITNELLAMVDVVRGILGQIETTGEEGDGDYSALVGRLAALAEGQPLAALDEGQPLAGPAEDQPVAAPAEDQPVAPAEDQPPAAPARGQRRGGATKGRARTPAGAVPAGAGAGPTPVPDTVTPADDDGEPAAAALPRLGELLVSVGAVSPDDIRTVLTAQAEGDPRRVGELLVDRGAATQAEVGLALRAQLAEAATVPDSRSNRPDSTIRVDVGLLDRLMTLVGELVLARNQVLAHSSTASDRALVAASQRLNQITTELQEGVMKTRMQPIGTIWGKFPRVVRDLSVTCGKQVRIEMQGADTELDKTIIEAIKDPMTHLVRNSVDHGIESPEARTAAGKPAEGRLLLRSFHEGGQVIIEITDDGGGIDGGRVRAKAVERGLLTPEQAERMSDREALNLIFLPGFSTATAVTNVSGRGVGMDVVKTNIERIGGSIDLQSWPGEGTTLRVKIPLTLAIIPALIVRCGGSRYAIPQVNLLELVGLDGDQVATAIESLHGAAVYRLRGQLLPLVYLRSHFGLEPAPEGDGLNIVVLAADGRRFGLVVDGVHDTEEIVVKPLGVHLKGISAFAGATIMGDGRVALILDTLGLAQRAGIVGETRDRALDHATTETTVSAAHDGQVVLLAEAGGSRIAIPLAKVDRLEEFPASAVERAGHREVVQYRGQILPLVRVGPLLSLFGGEPVEPETISVIVYREANRAIGLVVDRIVDIIEQSLTVDALTRAPGMDGSIVVGERVTDLLDVRHVVEAAALDIYDPAEAAP